MTGRKKQAGYGNGGLTGPRWPGSMWGPVKPIVPKAQKPTGIRNVMDVDIKSHPNSWRGRSKLKTAPLRTPESGFELTAVGQEAYENLLATVSKVDLTLLAEVEERVPGDREKIVMILEALALGARHREALGQVGWTWSNFSVYRARFGLIRDVYHQVALIGEETRKVIRLDEAHRRATDGVEESIYSASGKYCGTKIKYSDALLSMFLKADHPDKFSEKHEVKSSGVVLNMHMGLRDNVRTTPMTQGDIVLESPFEEKEEEIPGGG
jgi:hypothetical protein